MDGTNDPYQEMKALTRQSIRLIWEIAQQGGPLSEQDARLVQAMREHPEYADLWNRLDELTDAQIEREGINPILHVSIHQTIENQIANGEPKATGETVEALMQRGMSRHEAIHRVGAALSDEIWHILREQRPFDEAGFVRKLREIARAESARPRRAPGQKRRRRGGRW